jgi:ParB family transcriptional regulator, chromosome partitioning protein
VSEKRKALGRGLAALLPGAPGPSSSYGTSSAAQLTGEGLRTVAIEEVHPSASQPRKTFDDVRLGELAESIRVQGIIQPLVVRERADGGYELVAGERRWRAAQRAGLHEVPVVVREIALARAFEMALVENLQREDLNPIEEAEAYQRLVAEFGYTQESLAARVGKDRSTVANALRLLRLPEGVRSLVISGRLGMGHARALLGLESDDGIERVARQTVSRGLSVRQVEALVRRERTRAETTPSALPARQSPAARDLTERLQRALGARVRLVEESQGRGYIEIHFHSLDELDTILAKILPS